MTEPEWIELGRYLRWCADELGLRDWDIRVKRLPTEDVSKDEECYAQINMTYGRRCAVVRVCADFRTLDAETQRMSIVHEMLHCHFDAAKHVLTDDLYGSRALSQPHYQSLVNGHHRAIEHGVDAVATAIMKYFPMIEWTKKGGVME